MVIVNQTLADRFYPDQNPLGQRINVNGRANPVWREIVGVAEDVKNFGVAQGSRNAMYAPYYQLPTGFMSMVMLSSADPSGLIETTRSVIAEIDPNLAASNISTMESIVEASLGSDRFVTLLLSIFAGVALVLAVVGLYGVVSYGVTRRIREMGVRIAKRLSLSGCDESPYQLCRPRAGTSARSSKRQGAPASIVSVTPRSRTSF